MEGEASVCRLRLHRSLRPGVRDGLPRGSHGRQRKWLFQSRQAEVHRPAASWCVDVEQWFEAQNKVTDNQTEHFKDERQIKILLFGFIERKIFCSTLSKFHLVVEFAHYCNVPSKLALLLLYYYYYYYYS